MLDFKSMSKHPIQKKGHLKGYLAKDSGVRASVVVMTDLIEELCCQQGTSPSSSVALGRLLVGTVLVASQLKDDQAISFQLTGNKTIKKVFAHAQYDGLCRAFISEKQAPLSLEKNNLSLKPLIGEGILQAATYVPGTKQPQISQIEIQSGEIGEDIAYYLNQSCQIPCLISLSVKIGAEGKVVAAGGVLIELMPGHTEETLQLIEEQQQLAKSLSQLIEDGKNHDELLMNYLGGLEIKEVKSHSVDYGCTCSKEKAGDSLLMLEGKDFQEILASQEDLNVDCEMCGLVYSFDQQEVNLIYKRSGKASIH